MADIKYHTRGIPLDQKLCILQHAYTYCIHWWVDMLDCKISWTRIKTHMSFEEIMQKFNERCYFTIIWRDDFGAGAHGEVGFITDSGPDGVEYFLWIQMLSAEFEKMLMQYNISDVCSIA